MTVAAVVAGVLALAWWITRGLLTRRPAVGVPRRGGDAVRAALLALDVPGGAFRVRDGGPEGVDLVGEVRTDGRLLDATVRVLVVLDAGRRTARGMPDVQVHGTPFDGVVHDPALGWFPSLRQPGAGDRTGRGAAAAMRRALRDAVVRAGWTWRDVALVRRRGPRLPWDLRNAPVTLIGTAVGLLGLVFLWIGVGGAVSLADFVLSAQRTQGRVVELTAPGPVDIDELRSVSWYAEVEYTVDGRRFTVHGSTDGPPPDPDALVVEYRPSDPSDAYLLPDGPDVVPSVLFGVVGLVAASAGAVLVATDRRSARLRAWLSREGAVVWAPARVERDPSMQFDGSPAYVVVAEWRDEVTDRTHVARSEYLRDDPRARLSRGEACVRYDPADPDRNSVDLDAAR